MAEVLVIEFTAPNAVEIYNKVNHHLGWDGPAFEALNTPQPARMEWFSNVLDIHRH